MNIDKILSIVSIVSSFLSLFLIIKIAWKEDQKKWKEFDLICKQIRDSRIEGADNGNNGESESSNTKPESK